MRGVEDAPGSGAQALVVVGDHQLDAAQAALGEAAKEVGTEHLGLGVSGVHAEDLAPAVLVHGDSHYHARLTMRPAERHIAEYDRLAESLAAAYHPRRRGAGAPQEESSSGRRPA